MGKSLPGLRIACASVLASWDGEARALDRQGRTWTLTEDRLESPGSQALARLPAHRAFWFGWYAAYPATRLVK